MRERWSFLNINENWLNMCKFQWKHSHMWREFGWKCFICFFITLKQKVRFAGGNSVGVRKSTTVTLDILGVPDEKTFLGRLSQITKKHTWQWPALAIFYFTYTCLVFWLPEPCPVKEWADIVNDIYVMEKPTFALCLKKKCLH